MTSDQQLVLRVYARTAHTAHDTLTTLDQLSGDGDFGDNLREGLGRVVSALDARPGEPPFAVAAAVFLDEVGGTSGPLIGLLFQEIARAFADHDGDEGDEGDDGGDAAWRSGVREGLAAIQRVGEAEPGDRTMVDALVPAQDALEAGAGVRDVALAALEGAQSTSALRARRGRASYVGQRALGSLDPGALGVALLFWSRAQAEGRPAGELTDHLASAHAPQGPPARN
ncbi:MULTISPECIES: DAK2 domain-containing protein [unclassified Streptomyces]|uniref:DAK2 domain-containing protein n=1 Tax=unclassified Streptomyces TaxID=2593676 RepID=UPI002E0DD1C3|nr:DAK2 domain-containing protein [Streptomyces sp. NBC_01186]WSS39216.1 DAK2 domain-containing protein [Streptomyces sp. NBC_01187]